MDPNTENMGKILLDENGNLIDEHGRIIQAPTLKRSTISINKEEGTRKRKSFKLYDESEIVKEKRSDIHWDKELEKVTGFKSYNSRHAVEIARNRQAKRGRFHFRQKGSATRMQLKTHVRNRLKQHLKEVSYFLNLQHMQSNAYALQNLDPSVRNSKTSLHRLYVETPGVFELTELQCRLGSLFLDSNFPGLHLTNILSNNDFQELQLLAMQEGTQEHFEQVETEIEETPSEFFEWWDQKLINPETKQLSEESIAHSLIEHPVPIEPLEKFPDAGPLPLYMTKEERKRLRKQARMQRQKELQLKIRIGLIPPPPPKANLKNFMRVHLQSGIQDPTELEARIRAEIAQRIANHEARNQANKLTKEQRREKKREKAARDREKELLHSVYVVDNLTHPQHQFKIKDQAQKHCLTGCCLQCHQSGLFIVLVEGGVKASNKFKTLMLEKIKWDLTENNLVRTDLPEFEKNKCRLLWRGTHRRPVFKSFFWKKFETLEEMERFLVNDMNMKEYYNLCVQRGEELPTHV